MHDPSLSDVCSLIVDSEHKTAPKDSSGNHPLIRTANLGQARADLRNAQRVSSRTHALWTKRAVPAPGDLILAREAPVGGIFRVPEGIEPVLGQRTVLLRPNPSMVDSHFLMYRLASDDSQARMAEMSTGSTVPHLNMADIRAFLLPPLPSLAVQQRIGGVLSAFDKLIEINERRIELLEDLARSLYREWFVHFRFPGHEELTLTNSELGPTPEGWKVCSLDAVCSLLRSGSTPRRSDPSNWEGGSLPWFKTGELQDGPLFDSGERVAAEGRVRTFEPPAILMAIYGSPTVGRLGWLTRPSSCNQAALALRARNPEVEQDWLWYVLEDLRAHFNSMAQGAAQQNISKQKVAGTLITVPTTNLLREFAENIRPLRDLWEELSSLNLRLTTTRDLLLPRLVTGELDISDIDLGVLAPSEAE